MPMRRLIQIFAPYCAAGLLFVGSSASAFVSDRHDGVYVGYAALASEISGPSCGVLALTRIEIRNGIVRSYAFNGRQTVKGIVIASGSFDSDYIFADGRKALFEGFIDAAGRLAGGITSGPCAWVVSMSLAP